MNKDQEIKETKYKVGDILTNIRSGSSVLILNILGKQHIQKITGNFGIQSDGRNKEYSYTTWNGKFCNKNSEEELNNLYDLVESNKEIEDKIRIINNLFM